MPDKKADFVTADDVAKLAQKVELAENDYINAKDEADAATRKANHLLSRLNEAQKELDTALQKVQGRAPRSSWWQQSRMQKTERRVVVTEDGATKEETPEEEATVSERL